MTLQDPRAGVERLLRKMTTHGATLVLLLGCARQTPTPIATAPTDLGCSQLPDAGTNPLAFHEDASLAVVSSEDLPGVPDEWEPNRVAGVRASIPAPPGWSRAFLERRILCYRAAAGGRSSSDLLLVEGSTISVRSVRGRYEVTVTSDEPEIAQHIVDTVDAPQTRGAVAAR